jgi:hypothetical protein
MVSGRQGHFTNRTDGIPGKPVVAGPSLSELPLFEDDIDCFKRIHVFNNQKPITEVQRIRLKQGDFPRDVYVDDGRWHPEQLESVRVRVGMFARSRRACTGPLPNL